MKLYFTNLAAYNSGRLVGKWYDLEDYSDVSDLMADVENEVCNGDFNANEWAIHDYEAPFNVSEYENLSSIQAMIDFDGLDETDQQKAAYLFGNGNYNDLADCIANVDNVIFYEGQTLADVAYDLVEEGCFGEIPKEIANYIDYDAIARDLVFNGYDETTDGVFYVG